jgi:hypothetical protein
MPGLATPQLLSYAEVVDVDMDSTNDVNFADVQDYGHRVVVEVDRAAMDGYLGWQRAPGAARPSAKLITMGEAAFKAAIEAGLAGTHVDIDGVTTGLHYGSANLSTNPDARLRKNGQISANDLPLAFLLYKLYGSSTATTLDYVYNIQDAHEMLSNAAVSTAIIESFKSNEAGAVDRMFRDLLAADPHRFFDSAGVPMPGIFETRTDAYGSGTWKSAINDTVEVKLKLVFQSKVTRRGVAGDEHDLSASGSQTNEQVLINPGDYFYVRLQLKAKEVAGGNAGSSAGSSSGGVVNSRAIMTVDNAGGCPDAEATALVGLTFPITVSDQAGYHYGPNTGYDILYFSNTDTFMIAAGPPVITFALQSRGATSTYVAISDAYNRSSVIGQLTITTNP